MAGALLRSGSLTEFHPLGAVGKPVYSAASQLRAAVRRLYGAEAADLFAIPKRHDQAEIIDWYAPTAGLVVPWSAATPDERAEATAALRAARDRLADYSQALQRDGETSERQVFGRLLAQATRIPGDDHIYLVNGRPVITFWGFHPLNAPNGFDVIGGLSAAAAPVATAEEDPAVSPADAAATATGPAAATAAAATTERRRSWWWWLLPLLLLLFLLLLLIGLKSCGVPIPHTGWLPAWTGSPTASVDLPAGWKPVLDADGRAVMRTDGSSLYLDADGRTVAVYGDGRRVWIGADGSPVAADPARPVDPGQPAAAPADPARSAEDAKPDAATGPAESSQAAGPTDTARPTDPATGADGQLPAGGPPPPDPGKSPAGTPPPAVPSGAAAPPGTPLTIPEQAVRAGDTGFLNGAWRSISGLQDKSGNPVDLSYDFRNGQGPVTLRRTVGGQQQTCSGTVGSAMEGGRLTISQGEVRCPDGTVFQKSRVVCAPGAGGQARCQGINENGSTYDVDIVK